MATMNATVNDIIAREGLLVTDWDTGQEVMVRYSDTNRFSVGDNIRITYDGRMTLSIPPQITAITIQHIRQQQPPVTQTTRAIVVRVGAGFLMVRSLTSNRQIRVNYQYARHFCAGQRVIIRHRTQLLLEPPQINAIDITPIC